MARTPQNGKVRGSAGPKANPQSKAQAGKNQGSPKLSALKTVPRYPSSPTIAKAPRATGKPRAIRGGGTRKG